MPDRFVVGVPLGRWQTNCWLIGDHDRGSCAVIDPGEGGAEAVPVLLARLGVACEAILVTHGHLDHFWSVPALADALDVPIHAHPGDRWLWENPVAGFGNVPEGALEQMFGLRWTNPVDRLVDVADGDRIEVAGISYAVQHNPGHTPGHVTFLGAGLGRVPVEFAMGSHHQVPGDGVLFSGDLVFEGSIGRTDFPNGSMDQMWASLERTVLPLQDDTLILSGHGPDTTVGRERRANPFLAQLVRRG